jgi:hypothetical protein
MPYFNYLSQYLAARELLSFELVNGAVTMLDYMYIKSTGRMIGEE